jgi:multidrug resistance protein
LPRSLYFLGICAFLLMFGLGVLFPVLPFYVRMLGLSELQAGVLLGIYAAIGVVVAPLWGRFAERFGRKPAMLIGLAGFSGGFLLFGLGDTFAELLAARILGGLFAGAALPAIFAYAADVTAPERRSAAMGLIGASIGLGIIMGPVLGGVLAPVDLRLPFFVSAALGLVAALAVALLLVESLPPAVRQARRHAGAPPVPAGFVARLAPWLVVAFLSSTSRVGFEATIGFLVEDRFARGPRDVGLLLGWIGFVGVLVQGGAMRALTRRYADGPLLIVGTLLSAFGLGALGLAADMTMLAAAGALLATGQALAMPTITALVSRAGEASQGRAQGLAQSAQSLGRVAGPVVFTAIYQIIGPTEAALGTGALALVAGAAAWWAVQNAPTDVLGKATGRPVTS